MKHSMLLLVVGTLVTGELAGQTCSVGPGEVFGITAYQCANCGYKRETSGRPTFLFYAEPVVMDAKSPGVFRVGDVIEAVDGKPITTSAGAEAFTYPAAGDHEVNVRRGRVRQLLRLSTSGTGCDATSQPSSSTQIRLPVDDIESVEVLKGAAAAAQYGSSAPGGVIVISTRAGAAASLTPAARDSMRIRLRDAFGAPGSFVGRPQPVFIVDGVVVSPDEARALGVPLDRTGRFGFAVGCNRACTPETGKDGPLFYTFYRYSEFPSIMGIRPGGAADRAGLRAGDVVTRVDGVLVTDEEGGKKLARLERVDRARVTIRRDGKELELVLQADR